MFHETQWFYVTIGLILIAFMGWFFWHQRRMTSTALLVGINPSDDRAYIRRVNFKKGFYEWKWKGDNDGVDINLMQGFSYPLPNGSRLIVADVKTGDTIKIHEEEGRVLQERPPGSFLRAVRKDHRMQQMAQAAADAWGWVQKYAGLLIVAFFVILIAIIWMLWKVLQIVQEGSGV